MQLPNMMLLHLVIHSTKCSIFNMLEIFKFLSILFTVYKHHNKKSNKTFDFVYNDCGKSNGLNAINRQFAPYLYPFVIEYCILVVAICCKLYENVGHCTEKQPALEGKPIHFLWWVIVKFISKYIEVK